MEERQILSKKDANGSSIGNFWENQIVYEPPQYYKSFTKTQIEPTTIIEYTWEINRFMEHYKYIDTFTSESFPRIGQCKGQYKMEIIVTPFESAVHEIAFYLLSNTKSQGSVYISINATDNRKCVVTKLLHAKTSLDMSNRICICWIDISKFHFYDLIKPLIIHCKIEEFYQTLNNNMDLPVMSEASSKTLKSQNSILDNNSISNNKTIKFKINNNTYYIVPKELLRAINSSYFEYLNSTYKKNEKDMREELIDIKELTAFEHMLLFIISGSVPEPVNINYQDLLKVATRYDVQSLKLICEQYLLKEINVNNAIDFVKLAFSYDARYLEKCALRFIKFYFNEVVCTKAFQCQSQEFSDKLIQLLAEINITEICWCSTSS